MEVSPKPKRPLCSTPGRVATAIALALVIGAFGIAPARADDHHGGGNRGGAEHHGGGNRGGHRPSVHYAPRTDNYYAPQPNYYNAPEPNEYYAPTPEYSSPPQGINLFFGF